MFKVETALRRSNSTSKAAAFMATSRTSSSCAVGLCDEVHCSCLHRTYVIEIPPSNEGMPSHFPQLPGQAGCCQNRFFDRHAASGNELSEILHDLGMIIAHALLEAADEIRGLSIWLMRTKQKPQDFSELFTRSEVSATELTYSGR